jgi:hypothetical protein
MSNNLCALRSTVSWLEDGELVSLLGLSQLHTVSFQRSDSLRLTSKIRQKSKQTPHTEEYNNGEKETNKNLKQSLNRER